MSVTMATFTANKIARGTAPTPLVAPTAARRAFAVPRRSESGRVSTSRNTGYTVKNTGAIRLRESTRKIPERFPTAITTSVTRPRVPPNAE
jgi:hypothetical protein